MGAVGDITLNASWIRLDAKYYSSAAVDAKLAEQKSKFHTWKFLNTARQTQSLAMMAGNIYPVQLVSLNSLVPFIWFLLRQSTTGAGLMTGTQISSFQWLDSNNLSLQNGVLTRDAIARYNARSCKFNSGVFQNNYVYPSVWVPQPMEILKHPACNGFQWMENCFLSITAAITATVTLDAYALRWSILTLVQMGNLVSIIKSIGTKKVK